MSGTTHLGMALAAMLVAASAGAQTAAGPTPDSAWQTISVTGVGHVTLAPDRAFFTAGVQTVAPTLAAATQENATRMTAMLAAFRRAGAVDRDLRTSGLSIYPQQTQQEGHASKIVAYTVSNNVTVTRDDPTTVAKLLEAAVDSGANTVSGLSFTSDPARGREPGLQAAFADARAKAEVLAKAAGRTAGRALAIVEGEGGARPPIPMPRAYVAKAMVASAPVEAGAEEMTFTVSVVFELK